MNWEGTPEQHRRLLFALREALANYGAGHVATCLSLDENTKKIAGKLGLNKGCPINRTTLCRWIKELSRDTAAPIPDDAVCAFQQDADYARKQVLFQFLRSSEAVRTSLYDPIPGMPEGFVTFLSEMRGSLSLLRFDRLSNLDGTYHLYRPAWTTPERTDRVLISRLVIETVAQLTRYREEQDYRDPALDDMPVQQADHGIVFA